MNEKVAKTKVRISAPEVNHIKSALLKAAMLLAVPEVAIVLGCSDRKVFDLIRDGKLKAAGEKPGSKGIRVTGKSMEAYIDSITIAPEFWQR